MRKWLVCLSKWKTGCNSDLIIAVHGGRCMSKISLHNKFHCTFMPITTL